jgi:hypothetical protein
LPVFATSRTFAARRGRDAYDEHHGNSTNREVDVIKRIRCATRNPALTFDDFATAWREAVAAGAGAAAPAQPLRIAVCTSMPDVIADARHDGFGLEWFTDAAHVARFEEWLGSSDGEAVTAALRRALDLDGSPVVVAEEHVMRGADWLDRRWKERGEKFKHMAIAVRNQSLTLAQFFELWNSRAGKVGTITIPDEARGLAYIQNRPRIRADGEEWAYDAVNEVYFDDVAAMRTRIDYMEKTLAEEAEEDLVRQGWFVALREEVLLDQA